MKKTKLYSLLSLFAKVMICRWRYHRVLQRLRGRPSGVKIKVLFIVSSTSKWKCQSLYDLMKASETFEPVIGLAVLDRDLSLSKDEMAAKLCADRAFYGRHGDKCVDMVDCETRAVKTPSDFGADIVFPQEQWGVLPGHDVYSMSRYALVCYMPYSIEAPVEARLYCQNGFHRLLFLEFMWSEKRAAYCRRFYHWWNRAGRMPGTGHTTLDLFYLKRSEPMTGELVIYAPHYSFNHPNHNPKIHLSTFTECGKQILEYAKAHSEIKWFYKPHPTLYRDLVDCGAWTKSEVDAYDKAWNDIGITCYDGDYQELFLKSRVLITDCGSFLFEYAATGNPVIRLIPDNVNTFPCPAAKPVCDQFYNVHSLDEMYNAFDLVIRDRKDPKRETRRKAAADCGLTGNYAAEKVIGLLERVIGG